MMRDADNSRQRILRILKKMAAIFEREQLIKSKVAELDAKDEEIAQIESDIEAIKDLPDGELIPKMEE